MHRFSLAALAVGTLLLGCAQKDTTAPPAPSVEPTQSPTAATQLTLSGSAEYGATVKVTGGAAEVSTTADAFSARWFAQVTLTPDATNTLSVTATDAAGNVSAPATVTVVQATAKPASLQLSLSSSQVRAGEPVLLLAKVFDQYGNELSDATVTWESTPALAATFTVPGSSPALTKDQGVLAATHQFVAYDLSQVKSSGFGFTLKATAGTATGSLPLVVTPAAGKRFSSLAYTAGGTSATVPAGTDAPYTYEVVDLYGNVSTGPVTAALDAPGAVVVDDGVSGSGRFSLLDVAGHYQASFIIAGAGEQGRLTLDVGTAPGATVEASASATLASPSSAVKTFARVRDAYGNVIACSTTNAASLSFSAQGALGSTVASGAVSCFNDQFTASFTFSAEDTYAITASWSPTGATAAVTGSVFVTVLAFDNTPPTVSLSNLRVNGTPCVPANRTPAGCDVANGDVVDFDVAAADNTALSDVSYGIFFQSNQVLRTRDVLISADSASASISFRFTVSSSATETADLVASAVDRAGNRQNSSPVTFYAQFGAIPVGGRTLSLIASGTAISRPSDVVMAANGDVFIVNRNAGGGGGSSLARVPAGSSSAQLFVNNVSGEFITRATTAAGERLFVTDRNTGVVYSVVPGTGAVSTLTNLGGQQASGLSVLGAQAARGWVDLTTSAQGDQVKLQGASSETYELDGAGTCVAASGKVCVSVGTGATSAQKATALAAAMSTSALVTATAAGTQVVLVSKSSGETSSSLALSRVSTGIVLSGATLLEGHDADLYVSASSDTLVRRYLTSGGPFNGPTNHGQFTLPQASRGASARSLLSAASPALFDTMLYVIDSANQNTLSGYEVKTTTSGAAPSTAITSAFSVNSTSAGGTAFSTLEDTVVAPSGCLLVSDSGTGSIYAVDTRAPGAPASITVIARNISTPRGVALDNAGNLLFAADGSNAVFSLSQTSDPTDCF